MTGNRITRAILIVCAIVGCAVARGQEIAPLAPNCVITSDTRAAHSPHVRTVQVDCRDYDQFRREARKLGFPFASLPTGKHTQFVVRIPQAPGWALLIRFTNGDGEFISAIHEEDLVL